MSPPSSRLCQTARAPSGVGGPCSRSLCVPAPAWLQLVRNVLAPLCACTWAAEVGSPRGTTATGEASASRTLAASSALLTALPRVHTACAAGDSAV